MKFDSVSVAFAPLMFSILLNCEAIIFQSNDNRLFYVYEWSNNITNSWPHSATVANKDFAMSFYENHGVGPAVDVTKGLYKTFQYGLFRLFYSRLLKHKQRTYDPAEATSFFIPYDIGVDSSYGMDGKLKATNCPRANTVSSLLQKSPYFAAHGGEDHFLLHSINQPMNFFNKKPQCLTFITDICANCTKLSIDTYPQGYVRGQYLPRWHSIPFPSNYHYSSFVSSIPWQVQTQPPPPLQSSGRPKQRGREKTSRRKIAVSFVGTVQSALVKSRLVREELWKQCTKAAPLCQWQGLSSHGSGASSESTSASFATGMNSSSIPSVASEEDVVAPLSESSTFCLTPPGDFPTRKGFFDALLAGCIPVVFAPLSAHGQWPWHLGLEKAFSAAVYIPAHRLLTPQKPFNVVEYLIDLHYNAHDEVYLRQRAIEKIAFSLQYSLPEEEESQSSQTDSDTIHNRRHIVQEDALDISLRNVMRMHHEYRRCYHSTLPTVLVDSYQQTQHHASFFSEPIIEQECREKVVYGDHIDRNLAIRLLSFSYNINPAML